MRRVSVSVGGVAQRVFDIELAEKEPDWWASLDLAAFEGKTVTLALEYAEPPMSLHSVHQSDRIPDEESDYRERRRPQLRFSSRRGWLNDPNGLVFYAGEYHLFYQHNPFGTEWGNMHWGHAVSRDLVHWDELPIALYPDELGPAYSGSAVVDWDDTAGFQEGAEPALVAVYTSAGKPHTQSLAASTDHGRTWRRYHGNPVLPALAPQNRDPKVFWYAPDEKWVMILYIDVRDPDEHADVTADLIRSFMPINRYRLLCSQDLKHWDEMSEISLPEDGECPELFELPVAGSPGQTRWICFGAQGRYLVGAFDGKSFTTESGPHALHAGDCFYASQTFNDIPQTDGRRILIPWGITLPGEAPRSYPDPVYHEMPFNQSMGLPVELVLQHTDDGLRLFVNPVRELRSLRRRSVRIASRPLAPGGDPLSQLRGELWEIDADLAVGAAREIVFELRGVSATYDAVRHELSCLGRTASLAPIDGRIRLRIFVDRTAIDIFGNDGLLYMPIGVDLTGNGDSLSLRSEGGVAHIHAVDVHELDSIWAAPQPR